MSTFPQRPETQGPGQTQLLAGGQESQKDPNSPENPKSKNILIQTLQKKKKEKHGKDLQIPE